MASIAAKYWASVMEAAKADTENRAAIRKPRQWINLRIDFSLNLLITRITTKASRAKAGLGARGEQEGVHSYVHDRLRVRSATTSCRAQQLWSVTLIYTARGAGFFHDDF